MSKINWIKELSSPKMVNCAFNGFSAGLPLYFLVQLVPAWLRNEGVDLKTIGFFGLVLLPFSFKYLWAPILDNVRLPFLSRRRGWMLVAQLAVCLTMVSLAFFKCWLAPLASIARLSASSFSVDFAAFCSMMPRMFFRLWSRTSFSFLPLAAL